MVKENPDYVHYKNSGLSYSDGGAHPFGIYKNKAFIGDEGGVHFNIRQDLVDRGVIDDEEMDSYPRLRGAWKFPGRMWVSKKVISFWDFPKESQMKSIISKLEKAIGIKMWNNGWKVEVIDKGGKIYRPDSREYDEEEPSWYEYDTGGNIKLIPVEDYAGSQKQVGKGKSHVISPVLKKKKQVPKGMGSLKKVKGQRKGETPAAARHRLRKGLGDGVIKLKDLINEIFILYEDQSDELVKIARTQNGLIDPKGNAYYVPAISHIDFLVKQPKFKSYKKRLDQADSSEYSTLYESIMTEAMSDGWVRISGNRKELGFMATKKTLMRNKKLIDDIIIFVESVVKRPVKVYRSEFMIRKQQPVNYNKDFGND